MANFVRAPRGFVFKSLLIQDTTHLARVVDYIHLNSVRAGIVPAHRLVEFRASSGLTLQFDPN